jgi:hypothetical protein
MRLFIKLHKPSINMFEKILSYLSVSNLDKNEEYLHTAFKNLPLRRQITTQTIKHTITSQPEILIYLRFLCYVKETYCGLLIQFKIH